MTLERNLYALMAEGMPESVLQNALEVLSESAVGEDWQAVPTWTDVDMRRLLQVTADDRLGAAWRLLLIHGLSPSEILALEWSRVQLSHGRLMFRPNAGADPDVRGYAEVVPLDRGTVAAMHRLRRWRSEARAAAGGEWVGGNRVFIHADGAPLTCSELDNHLREVTVARGLPSTTLDDLATTYGATRRDAI